MRRRFRRRAAVAVAAVSVLTLSLASCSSGGGAAAGSAGSTGKVTIQYWSGMLGSDKLVAKWNAAHPDIQVVWSDAPGTVDDQAAKLLDAEKAGNGPCVAELQSDRIPSLLSSGVFQDVTQYTKGMESQYYPGTWSAVTYGGVTYGLPVDTGPSAMFYRADLFAKYHISVPTTWAQFAQDAKTVAHDDPGAYLTGMAADDAAGFNAMVEQIAPSWFSIDGQSWKVSVDSAASQKVADYWQSLLDQHLLNTSMRWDPTFYKDLSDGKELAIVGGAWQAPLIQANVKGGAGHWAVAPMPTFDGKPASTLDGGSSLVVIKGCQASAQAVQFASWFTRQVPDLVNLGAFPAANTATVPTPAALKSYFSGQDVNTVLADAARTVQNQWSWSPTWNAAQSMLQDTMGQVLAGKQTLRGYLAAVQQNQVGALRTAGISVTG